MASCSTCAYWEKNLSFYRWHEKILGVRGACQFNPDSVYRYGSYLCGRYDMSSFLDVEATIESIAKDLSSWRRRYYGEKKRRLKYQRLHKQRNADIRALKANVKELQGGV